MKDVEKDLEKLGYKRIFVRDVPFGVSLSAKNAELFEFKPTDTFKNEKTNIMVIPCYQIEGHYRITPPEPSAYWLEQGVFFNSLTKTELLTYLKNHRSI